MQSPNQAQQANGQVVIEGGQNISQTTKNAWQAIEFNQARRDVNGTFAINTAGSNASGISGVQTSQ